MLSQLRWGKVQSILQIPRIDSDSLCGLAGRYDNPIPTRFRAPIDCSKFPALLVAGDGEYSKEGKHG